MRLIVYTSRAENGRWVGGWPCLQRFLLLLRFVGFVAGVCGIPVLGRCACVRGWAGRPAAKGGMRELEWVRE